MDELLQALHAHLDTHPAAQIQDAVKFLYQACFGGGHMIADPHAAYAYLCAEAAALPADRSAPLTESLGDYVRLDLSALRFLSPETMNAMFVASAEDALQDKTRFLALLDAFCESDWFDAAEKRGATVYHAGTKLSDGQLVTAGGLVLGVTATGDTLRGAVDAAYAAAREIHFEGAHMRSDIGSRDC